MKYKLAALTSHPIQYQVPLFRKLANHPRIELTVYFCSRHGVEEAVDKGFGRSFKWDVPLLKGYDFKFLRNYSPKPTVNNLFGLFNPGIVGELVHKRSYDALFVHGYRYPTYLLAIIIARVLGIPILYRSESSLHYDENISRPMYIKLLKPAFLRLLFKSVSGFLAIGSRNREFYQYYGVPDNRIFHCPYAVDNDFFAEQADKYRQRKKEIKTQLGIDPNDVVILFVSKLIEIKRPIDALRAHGLLSDLDNNPALLFVGDGKLRPRLERYVRENSLPNVYFVGFKNQSMLPKYYAIGDIFLRTDGYHKGDWGLTINEAMAAGLPIISSNSIGAVDDLVRDGKNGFTFHLGDVRDLASKLELLVKDRSKRLEMGKKSQQIISQWSYEDDVNGILKSLQQLKRLKEKR